MWEVNYSYIEEWLDKQDDETVACVFAALKVLEAEGPNLGRPLVDALRGCSAGNLKELRPASPGRSEVRIIFAFDFARQAVMLLAGDKAKGRTKRVKWSRWYKVAIPKAESLLASHQDALRKEGFDVESR